ncbi:hypothetical protein [Streptacidiphilus sp. MAP12-33]|uniref:DUF6928 family protein n=1 Tax=Streptacidiphilus sp. MAP12-33 TaxID=3156266 RepID=UPI0035157319
MEDIGERFAFEAPIWIGEHPVELDEAWGEQDPYPLAFHPLELGEEALRAFFGFVLEGMPEPDDIDPYEVALRGFHLTAPGGPTSADKEAVRRAAVSRMGPPRMLTYGPEGTLIVVDRR